MLPARAFLLSIAAGAIVALAACGGGGDGGTSPDTPSPIVRVDVRGMPVSLEVGATATLSAIPIDDRGLFVSGTSVSWTVTPDSVATVDAAGTLTARRPGVVQVAATSMGRTGSASVTVVSATVASIAVTFDRPSVLPGQSAQAAAIARDARGVALGGRAVAWTVDDVRVATVDVTTGVVRAVAPGTVRVTATSEGRSGAATLIVAPPPVAISIVVAGQAVAAGNESLRGLWFGVRPDPADLPPFGTSLDAHGAFQLADTVTAVPTDSVTLVVDATTGSTRAFQPVVVRTTLGMVPREFRPLLVPTSVTLPATSRYAGPTRSVSLRAAFTAVCTNSDDANCNSFFPASWTTGAKLWPDRALPIPIAFNRTAVDGATIAAGDSVAFWAIVRQMEADVGQPLFRPASLSDVPQFNSLGMSEGAVLVRIDPTLAAGSAWTNWWWNGAQDLIGAVVRVASPTVLGSPAVVMHELLHALGLHHTCAWPTVMGGYGCQMSSEITGADVAALTLAYQVWHAQTSNALTTGLYEALVGERMFGFGGIAVRDALAGSPTGALTGALTAASMGTPAEALAGRMSPRMQRVGATTVYSYGAP